MLKLAAELRKNFSKIWYEKDVKTVNAPLTPGIKLSLQDSPDEVDPELQRKYQEIIGSLMYLYQWTRPSGKLTSVTS